MMAAIDDALQVVLCHNLVWLMAYTALDFGGWL